MRRIQLCFSRAVRTLREKANKIWDSLTANAYGIYLVHYAFVSWLQYALLKTTLPQLQRDL